MKKYACYETGEEKIYTEDQMREYFENEPDLDVQKEQGTTFDSWMCEMLKMQILDEILE